MRPYGTVCRAHLTEAGQQLLPGLDMQQTYALKRVKKDARQKRPLDEIRRSALQISIERHVEFWRAISSKQCAMNNVICIHAQIIEVGGINTILELLEGPDLFDWTREHAGTINEGDAAHIARQILTGTHYLHRSVGILHRDIKLENFGFTQPHVAGGPLPTLKLFDLGFTWMVI